MSIFFFERQPEAEGMGEEEDVDAYTSSTAQEHLEKLDSEFVRQIESVNVWNGLALDVGTGPGAIPAKLCLRHPDLTVIGLDVSMAMLRRAKEGAGAAGISDRLLLVCADVKALPFADGRFDLLVSNSLIHHLHDPLPFLNETSRVVKKTGAVVMKDLRRPPWFLYRLHVAYFGRKYEGRMKALFEASVRSAFTSSELCGLLSRSGLSGCNAIRWGSQYILIARPPGR